MLLVNKGEKCYKIVELDGDSQDEKYSADISTQIEAMIVLDQTIVLIEFSSLAYTAKIIKHSGQVKQTIKIGTYMIGAY